MEITIHLMESGVIGAEGGDNRSWREKPILGSTFVFVSLTPDGKPAKVNQLEPETDEEVRLFKSGASAKASRKQNRMNDLSVTPPTSDVSSYRSHKFRL